jgi:hypothetical protein
VGDDDDDWSRTNDIRFVQGAAGCNELAVAIIRHAAKEASGGPMVMLLPRRKQQQMRDVIHGNHGKQSKDQSKNDGNPTRSVLSRNVGEQRILDLLIHECSRLKLVQGGCIRLPWIHKTSE